MDAAEKLERLPARIIEALRAPDPEWPGAPAWLAAELAGDRVERLRRGLCRAQAVIEAEELRAEWEAMVAAREARRAESARRALEAAGRARRGRGAEAVPVALFGPW